MRVCCINGIEVFIEVIAKGSDTALLREPLPLELGRGAVEGGAPCFSWDRLLRLLPPLLSLFFPFCSVLSFPCLPPPPLMYGLLHLNVTNDTFSLLKNENRRLFVLPYPETNLSPNISFGSSSKYG